MKRKVIEVVEYDGEKVVHTVDVSERNESSIDRIDRGMNVNLDHTRFFTRVVERKVKP